MSSLSRGLKSFRIQLTVLCGGLALAMSLGLTVYVNYIASAHLNQDSADTIQGIAQSIANALAANITERQREVILLSQSPLLTQGNLADRQVRDVLDRRIQTYPNYAWFGVANTDGIVQSAAGGLLEGQNVSQRPWFIKAQEQPYLGDAHEAVLLAKLLKIDTPGEPLRFIDFAAPVRNGQGELRGVVAAHAHWSWVSQTIKRFLPKTADEDRLEVLIIGKNGNLLYPYSRIGSLTVPAVLRVDGNALLKWGEEGDFLTSSVSVKSDTTSRLGWHVIVREPVARALAPAIEMHRHLLLLGGIATIAFMFLAYRLAAGISRPIETLAKAARRIRQGEEDTPFAATSTIREVNELSDSLRGMTVQLITRKHELEQINATLEQKVHERTAELREANRELELLARYDALTGLRNRFSANEHLRAEFLRMKRTGVAYAVLLMDIDYFKRVNDTYGHEVGDQILQHVAKVLRESVRSTDFLARFGGEEFLVVLTSTEQHSAVLAAEKIRHAVAAASAPTVGQVTLSIGVAMAGLADASEDEAVRQADRGLYQAKAQGRNRVATVPPQHDPD